MQYKENTFEYMKRNADDSSVREFQDEMVSLYRDGEWTVQSLALHYGVSREVIMKLLKEKIDLRAGTADQEWRIQVSELYVDGLSVKEIASKLQISSIYVSRLLYEVESGRKMDVNSSNRPKNMKVHKGEMIRLYVEEKWSIRKIAEYYGVNKNTVSNLIKDQIEIRKGKVDEKFLEKMFSLYLEGLTYTEIAKRLDVTRAYISRLLEKHYGIVNDMGKSSFIPLRPVFAKLYQSGKSAYEIAEMYGTTAPTVIYHLQRYNVEMRSYQEAGMKDGYDISYFDEIDSEKSYQLGLLWGLGIYTADCVQIAAPISRYDLLKQCLRGWVNIEDSIRVTSTTDRFYIQITSKIMVKTLLELGFPLYRPKVKGLDLDSFWKGYLLVRTSYTNNRLYVSFKNKNSKLVGYFCDYLVRNPHSSYNYKGGKYGLNFGIQGETARFMFDHPFLMEAYNNRPVNTTFWNGVVTEYNRLSLIAK